MRRQELYVPCSYCKNKIKTTKWELNHRLNHFCGLPCRYSWQKLQPGFFRGKQHSLESRLKNSLSNRGKPKLGLQGKSLSQKHRKTLSEARKRYYDQHPEVKEKIRQWATGRKQSPETIVKRTVKNTGAKRTPEQRARIRAKARKGKDSHFWKGGVTPVVYKLRRCTRYNAWRQSVFKRDNYTCVLCNAKRNIESDHYPKTFSDIIHFLKASNPSDLYETAYHSKELWDISNGRTLCKPCHRQTETFGKNFYTRRIDGKETPKEKAESSPNTLSV